MNGTDTYDDANQAHRVESQQEPAPAAPLPDYKEIVDRLKAGTIVPFFGAGASISCGLPSGTALAERLVEKSHFPADHDRHDLSLVASYLANVNGDLVSLKTEVRDAIGIPCEPGRLHRLLADPRFAFRLFVTTNYDDLIERALEARAPWVVVDRGRAGNVWCRPFGGDWEEVESKNLGYHIRDDQRPIVLKLHGSFDRNDRDSDSFLITEEDYVDFLGRSDGGQIPQKLALKLRDRSFLFLGYGLRDWNIRVLLHKLVQMRERRGRITSWAIVRNPSEAERRLWERQGIQLHDVDLDQFVSGLESRL